MVMTGALLPLLLASKAALARERGTQSDVRAKGMRAGGGLKAGLTINAVKFCKRSEIAERLTAAAE